MRGLYLRHNNRTSAIFASLVFISLLSISLTSGFVPIEEQVNVYTFSDAASLDNIEPGIPVNFSIVVKNLSNDTIHNITIFQNFAKSFETETVKLLESPLEKFGGEPINHTSSTGNIEVEDKLTGNMIKINYLNITLSNFTLNFEEIKSGFSIGIGYSLNFTQELSIYSPDATLLTYYDHWGDEQSESGKISPSFNIQLPEENEIAPYFPSFETEDELNPTQIFLTVFIVIIVAYFGRILYLKNPFKL